MSRAVSYTHLVITNLSDTPLNVSLTWSGGVFEENTTATKVDKMCISDRHKKKYSGLYNSHADHVPAIPSD